MKQIELYDTWFDKKGNHYAPGIYSEKALPSYALDVSPDKGRVINPNEKEKTVSKKEERIVETNNKLRQVLQETSKPKPEEPKPEEYTKTDYTPRKKRTPKTTKNKNNIPE